MNQIQIINKNLPETKTIWTLVDNRDFKAIIDTFLKAGVNEKNIGELFFNYVDQAVSENKFNTAIIILLFLTDALEDKSEALPLFKKIGDIYTLTSEHEKAREYYGKLPLTLENIKLCLQTYIPTLDIENLLSLRDIILTRIPKEHHGHIHDFIDDTMMKIAIIPEILDAHLDLYQKNMGCFKTLPPFSSDSRLLDNDWSPKPNTSWKPVILRISDTVYIKKNIWQTMISNVGQIDLKTKILSGNENIMTHCNSLESLFDFINMIQTQNPKFIKYDCRIIIDFSLLKSITSVFDLSPLTNCDFVVRFIDKENLKAQLTHLLFEKKLPFTNRVIHLSQDDPVFFSKHVMPTIDECARKMHRNIKLYKQQLLKIFPNSYQNTILEKIRAKKNLKILLFTSKFTTYLQYSTRDIAQGFSKLGHETLIEMEDEDSGVTIRKDVCLENLINFQPDIIFAIDHLRYSYPWIPKTIPFVTWIQDLMPHLLKLNDDSKVTSNDYIFSISQHWIDTVFKTHPIFKEKNIYCLPVTIDHDIYHPLTSCKKKYDITYISHLQDPALTFLPVLEGVMIPEVTSDSTLMFLKQLIDDLDKLSLAHLHKIRADKNHRKQFVNKICHKIGLGSKRNKEFFKLTDPFDENKAYSRFYYHFLLLMKSKPIMALIKNNLEVRVFGKNWDKLPQFKNIAMGIAKNGNELNKIINQSRINLNLSAEISYHMKAPEVIATDSFMITRRISNLYDLMPITNFFKEGKEIILFDDESDLVQKASFFLKNKIERESIASAAYHKFIESFSVEKEAQFILNKLVNS